MIQVYFEYCLSRLRMASPNRNMNLDKSQQLAFTCELLARKGGFAAGCAAASAAGFWQTTLPGGLPQSGLREVRGHETWQQLNPPPAEPALQRPV